MGQDNNSPAENVHNTTSGALGPWIEKEKKYMYFSTKMHNQNMGQDNNSLPENVHNTTSGALGQ